MAGRAPAVGDTAVPGQAGIADPPLILTLALDAASQGFFERERQRWFPAARNMIPAHVTLFHHLPGDRLPRLGADLSELCADAEPALFDVGSPMLLGSGVAYAIHAPAVAAFRARLVSRWRSDPDPLDLTAQDRQPWRPHVTVQNKVPPAQARALHARLVESFMPFAGVATGTVLWRYLGGPWELERGFAFGGAEVQSTTSDR